MAVVQELTICSETEFNPEPGFHDDQEGFLYWKEMDLSDLTTNEFEVKRVIHS